MTAPSPPPVPGGTTLEQELEEAAKYIDSRSGGWHSVAGRLRARAARVRELDAANLTAGGRYVFLELCGPLSPTEPAATPTEKGRP